MKVWKRYPRGGAGLALLQAIAEASNEQGNCYLPVGELAHSARMSRKNAFRAVERLRAGRWVVTSRILGQGGMLVFQINVPKLERSCRPLHDEPRVYRQRCRGTGRTEARLIEQTAQPEAEGQVDPVVEPEGVPAWLWTEEQRMQWEADAKVYVEARMSGMKVAPGTLRAALSHAGDVRGDDGLHD